MTGSARNFRLQPVTLGWVALAFLMFVGGAWSIYGEVWRKGPTVFVPAFEGLLEAEDPILRVTRSDYGVVVGRVSRNARALVSEPWHLFRDEQCHPVEEALAMGDPMIASGLLGTPGHLATADPVATYNVALVLMALLSATAMMVLVWSWSGVPAAGIAAGIVYAFHAWKLNDVAHPYILDTAWTVLAMLFAWRLFERGRLRDAIALGACCVLQMGEAFYPFLAAVFLALPFGAWLLFHRRGLPPWPGVAVAVAIIAVGGFWIFSPYLEAVSGERKAAIQYFAAWSDLAPWRLAGWPAAALVTLALVVPRRICLREGLGDPRWSLVAGAVLVGMMAAGGNTGDRSLALLSAEPPPYSLPDPYRWLAQYVPGLSAVRVPWALSGGVQVVFGVLTGLGFACLIRLVPERGRTLVGVLLVLLIWLHTLRPEWLDLAPREHFQTFRIRPTRETLEFYDRLEELGNAGPLLELPVNRLAAASGRILQSAYHHRRISACYMSVVPDSYHAVTALSLRFPLADSVQGARDLGFTTVVLDHPPGNANLRWRAARVSLAVIDGMIPLRRIHATETRTAYEILPVAGREAAPKPPRRAVTP